MAQAESTWVAGSVPVWFTRPNTVTHPGTNRARCRVTTLIESNVSSNTFVFKVNRIIFYKVIYTVFKKSKMFDV